jgi:hypothetical protein
MSKSTRTPLIQRLFDGGRTWGSLQMSASRYGTTRYRLVVFPPGTSRDERIALRLWRSFPGWGVAAWVVGDAALTAVTSPGVAFALATGGCLAAGATAMARTNHTRGNVRTLTVVWMLGVNDPLAAPRLDELRELAELLINADAELAAGELSQVDHEAKIWQVYDRMSST